MCLINLLAMSLNTSPEIKVFTDGASRGNPGPSSIGIVIYDMQNNLLFEHKERLGQQTNNFAEYMAVIRALEICLEQKVKKVHVFCDSELLVKQMKGLYKVKAPQIQPLHQKAKILCSKFDAVEFNHVRREFNKEADALANEALDFPNS